MILSCIILVQFQFDLDLNQDTATVPKPPGSGGSKQEESKKCKQRKNKLTGSDVQDCQINKVQSYCQATKTIDTKNSNNDAIFMPYYCTGEQYDQFATALHAFADDVTHGAAWGRRAFGIPSHKTILMLGNADTIQIAHSLVCRHLNDDDEDEDAGKDGKNKSPKIESIQAPLSDKQTAQKIKFSNNATLVILTDDKIVQKTQPQNFDGSSIAKTIQQETGLALSQYDGMIWGLFHDCGSISAQCPNTTQPLYFATAQEFEGPMLFIGMMADARTEQALAIRDEMKQYKNGSGPTKLWFISGRRYISKLKLEGSTIYGNGTDADNVPKTGRYGHRCTGQRGGHSDLLAFDVTEFLYNQLFYV